ncbi:hypothetical protein STTU_0798 [Streptomyces sp. Tu6071]|nr:hypothetical protein STTU_0798 [Streptomyces sp. Tu6071]
MRRARAPFASDTVLIEWLETSLCGPVVSITQATGLLDEDGRDAVYALALEMSYPLALCEVMSEVIDRPHRSFPGSKSYTISYYSKRAVFND